MATVTQEQYDAIPWAEVESSNIDRVAWECTGTSTLDPDVEIGTLHVEFGSSPGRAYRYVNAKARLENADPASIQIDDA